MSRHGLRLVRGVLAAGCLLAPQGYAQSLPNPVPQVVPGEWVVALGVPPGPSWVELRRGLTRSLRAALGGHLRADRVTVRLVLGPHRSAVIAPSDRQVLLLLRPRNPAVDRQYVESLIRERRPRRDRWDRHEILWVAPNRRYPLDWDPREGLRNSAREDPLLGAQRHHAVIGSVAAWDLGGTQGHGDITVAVTDDGFDLDHEDLRESLWRNPGEVAANDEDDDGNGYVDDVFGYDFVDHDADPSAEAGAYHGTHVAGLVAAQGGNGRGGAGVAPKVRVMPLRFYGMGQPWTSAMIAEAYGYAADQGARILTTSYNIDGWVGDPVFAAAIEYVRARGVLHFNSAGNFALKDPPRQAFTSLILVCSTIADGEDDDRLSDFSNYGSGIDLCAPGGGGREGILSTIPQDRYDRQHGTSMAAPIAAGVAALLLSVSPELTADRARQLLLDSAERIDVLNPGFEGLMGAGRVDALRVVQSQL